MSQPLPIVADLPTTSPGLGFPEYIAALADAVRGGEPPQFTIGLYGAWGTGKSSLLGGLREALLPAESGVIPVLFDAWRYERSDHIVIPLLHQITEAVDAAGHKQVAKHLKRALKALIYSVSFSVGHIQLSGAGLAEHWSDEALPALDEAFSRPFAELRQIPAALTPRRIAVLIDDLDRCSPSKIVAVLESIKLVMDIPGFVFVLALDYDVLTDAVQRVYPHVSAHHFVEKIIQLPFRVPPLAIDSETFLVDTMQSSSTDWQHTLSPLLADTIVAIARIALRSNPRQVKRLINSFMLAQRIVAQRGLEVDAALICATIGLQLGWPDVYDEFQDAVMADAPEPLKLLTTAPDDKLGPYAEHFFAAHDLTDGQLRAIIRLAAVLAPDRAPRMEGGLGSVRAARLAQFLRDIADRGFTCSSRSDRLYYNPAMSHLRVALSDSRYVVRIEARAQNGSWRLRESYLVTRDTAAALYAIDHPDQVSEHRT